MQNISATWVEVIEDLHVKFNPLFHGKSSLQQDEDSIQQQTGRI
jgi:hypothetical protein